MDKNNGSCLCESVKLSCKNLPAKLTACYCYDCQKSSGGSGSFNLIVSRKDLSIKSGKLNHYSHKAKSGRFIKRYFCSLCGSPIYSEIENQEELILKVGLFSGKENFIIEKSIFTSRKPNWCPMGNTGYFFPLQSSGRKLPIPESSLDTFKKWLK
jgi:hypothetical protein